MWTAPCSYAERGDRPAPSTILATLCYHSIAIRWMPSNAAERGSGDTVLPKQITLASAQTSRYRSLRVARNDQQIRSRGYPSEFTRESIGFVRGVFQVVLCLVLCFLSSLLLSFFSSFLSVLSSFLSIYLSIFLSMHLFSILTTMTPKRNYYSAVTTENREHHTPLRSRHA